MLHYSLVFLVIAFIAGMLGFTDVSGTSMYAAQILFFVFLIFFVLSLLVGRRTPTEAI